MKTLCNEIGESVYLFPDFIPIKWDEDAGQWLIQDQVINDIPHYYVLHEKVSEPKLWYSKKYKYLDGEWLFNVDWDGEDFKVYKNLHRKINKMLKVFYQKGVLTKEEMNNLFNTDDLL